MNPKSESQKRSAKHKRQKRTPTRLAMALQYGVAGLRVAQVYGVKDGRCLCGEDCAQIGEHLRTPIDDATSKAAEIEALGPKWSSSRIAIATGVDEVIALRVTGKKPQAALAEAVSLAATPEVIDGSSRIYLWRAPADNVPEGRIVLRTGVEILGGGAYFIAPNDLNTTHGRRRFAVGGVVSFGME